MNVRIRHDLKILLVLACVVFTYGMIVLEIIHYGGNLEGPILFSVIGTSIAIVTSVLAMIKDPIIDYVNAPCLRVEFYPSNMRDCHLTSFTDQSTGQTIALAHYFRLRIYNDGWHAAEEVQVSIEEIKEKTTDGFVLLEQFTPQRLFWSHWREKRPELTIPSGIHCYCDFGFVIEPDKLVNGLPSRLNERRQFWLDVMVRPNYGKSSLDPGSYEILVTASCRNSASVSKRIDVEWKGEWHKSTEEFLNNSMKFS